MGGSFTRRERRLCLTTVSPVPVPDETNNNRPLAPLVPRAWYGWSMKETLKGWAYFVALVSIPVLLTLFVAVLAAYTDQ
jgi:hypothetical protein